MNLKEAKFEKQNPDGTYSPTNLQSLSTGDIVKVIEPHKTTIVQHNMLGWVHKVREVIHHN